MHCHALFKLFILLSDSNFWNTNFVIGTLVMSYPYINIMRLDIKVPKTSTGMRPDRLSVTQC